MGTWAESWPLGCLGKKSVNSDVKNDYFNVIQSFISQPDDLEIMIQTHELD